MRAPVDGVGAHRGAQLRQAIGGIADGCGLAEVALGRVRAQLSADPGAFLRAAQRRTSGYRHAADDPDPRSDVLGGQRSPRAVLGDDRHFEAAGRGGSRRPDDAQAPPMPPRERQDVARANACQDTARLLTELPLARACAGLLSLANPVTQGQILAHVAARTRQVVCGRVAASLTVDELGRELNNRRIGLKLGEGGL